MNNLNFRKGNQVYFLYLEKRKSDIEPIGFFGRVSEVKKSCIDTQLKLAGYELLVPAYKVCFDEDLMIKEVAPRIFLPQSNSPYAIKSEESTIGAVNIELSRSLDNFLQILTNHSLIPNSDLYGDMQKAIKKLRIKPEYI
jgi:hypothetical protein